VNELLELLGGRKKFVVVEELLFEIEKHDVKPGLSVAGTSFPIPSMELVILLRSVSGHLLAAGSMFESANVVELFAFSGVLEVFTMDDGEWFDKELLRLRLE
jgi:hypothetical protein